jgi:hypothetical protein
MMYSDSFLENLPEDVPLGPYFSGKTKAQNGSGSSRRSKKAKSNCELTTSSLGKGVVLGLTPEDQRSEYSQTTDQAQESSQEDTVSGIHIIDQYESPVPLAQDSQGTEIIGLQ